METMKPPKWNYHLQVFYSFVTKCIVALLVILVTNDMRMRHESHFEF